MNLLPLLLAVVVSDPHSLANPELVGVRHARLELKLDFERKLIDGVAELQLAYPKGPDAANHLDLDTHGLVIIEIVAAGSEASLEYVLGDADPVLGRRLHIVLPEPRPKRVRIAYQTSPEAKALQWLEPHQTTSGQLPFLLTQSQSVHARSWVPCQDSPGVRFTYEATVHVPPGMQVVMSAAHGVHEPERGLFRFRMPQPIPAYLLALAAGEMAFQPLSARAGVWAEPAVLEQAARELEDVEPLMRATEALYGPYQWERYDVIVLPPSFPFGGMENPRITFLTPTILAGDKSLVSLLAHELAHSWSGNLVTNATWADFWLNEGVTSYIETRIVEAVYGLRLAGMQVRLAQRDLMKALLDLPPDESRLFFDVSHQDPDRVGGAVPYDKGANLLRMLEKRFGRERFDAFLRGYFDAHAFESITTAGFLELLKRELFCGDDAAWRAARVDQWVYGVGIPANLDVPQVDAFDRTRAAAEVFAATGVLEAVHQDEWVTAEWLDFLGRLPPELQPERLARLDTEHGFSRSGNSEIRFAFLLHVARNGWEPGLPALETFLSSMGRRRFVQPLFEALLANPETRDWARALYQRVRPGYHPITAAAVDALLAE